MCSLWNHLVNRGCSMNDWWLWMMFIRIKFSYLYAKALIRINTLKSAESFSALLHNNRSIVILLLWRIYGYSTTFSITSLYYVSLSDQRRIFNIWSIDFQLSRVLSLSINQSYHLNNFYLLISLLSHARTKSDTIAIVELLNKCL